MENLIAYGSAVKVLETDGDLVTIGGPALIYDDPASPRKDLTGDYFTRESYLGPRRGDGVDVLFHHGFPIAGMKAAEELADYLFPPVKTEDSDEGLLASVILDRRKKYERMVYELVEQKALGWSTATASHTVRRADDGWLKRWPIIEISLTPEPAEPRTGVLPMKSLLNANRAHDEAALVKALADLRIEIQTITALRAIGY